MDAGSPVRPPTRSPEKRELPTDRLATSDQDGYRIYLYPSDVKGFFRTLRNGVQSILILVFLAAPWIRISGHPAILLDIPHRRFALLGLTFWAHDTPIIFFLLLGAALSLGFVTALWGRIWCGWACPQTVFIDGVFRRVERWLEGDSIARKKLDDSPLSLHKLSIKAAKWGIFTAISLIITHSFLAYFVGIEALPGMIRRPPSENLASFLIMLGTSLAILFDFGWFREQFCTMLCPYARFQTVLMDEMSVTVAYDSRRGEPRRGSSSTGQAEGDCVNCYRCVQVCPTGVDIRRGTQLECIACTACVDVCDEVMTRLKRPPGLIRYASLTELKSGKAARSARPWIYGTLALIAASALAYVLATRKPITLTLVRPLDFPYSLIQRAGTETEVTNRFTVKIYNEGFESRQIRLSLSDSAHRPLSVVTATNPIPVQGGESKKVEIFIQFPKSFLGKNGELKTVLKVDSISDPPSREPETLKTQEVTLVGPES